jgi:nucleoside 2-deoxyribosyltransferase
MPFTERPEVRPKGFFDEVLKSLITPAGVSANFSVETANRQGSDVIQSTIINDLLEADLVLADLTDHNPNVLFELGLRMAIDKPVVLIKASGTGRIFDVDNMLRVYEYNANLWQSTIEKDFENLTEHIKGAWENRSSEQTYMKILRKGNVAK